MLTKAERIDLRVPRELKELATEAATATGMSLSAFVASAVQELAVRVTRNRQVVMLSDRDRDRFLTALDRPARPQPEAIRKAKTNRDTAIIHE